MLRFLYVFIFLALGSFGHAQKITVIGNDSGQPIKGVSVSNIDKSKVAYTNNEGVVDLSIFKKKALVFVYHYLYSKEKHLVSDFGGQNTLLKLEKITKTLDEVVLSVSRGREKRNRIAEQIEVFTAKEIKRIAPQTTADLLAASPGVKVQKTQFGGGSPVLRGMEANRVLLVVDGVRMNNAIYRKGHLQNAITVAPSLLNRVEVLFGPSSVIYGSDALGGVIHYYTKELKISENKQTNASFMSRYSSANKEFTSSVDTELSFGKWASYTSFSFATFGDLTMGKNRSHGHANWGKVFEYSDNTPTTLHQIPSVNSNPNLQRNTGYSQKDFLQKIYFPASNDVELLLNFQYSTSSKIPRFDRLTERTTDNALKFAEWFYGPQKRLLFSTQLKLDAVHRFVDSGAITFAYQDIQESRIQRKFDNILQRTHRNEKVNVLSVNGDFTVALTNKKDRNLSYGFELVANNVNSSSFGEQLVLDPLKNEDVSLSEPFFVPSRYPDGGSTYFTQAAYLGYRQDLDKKNTLNTGIRYTRTQLNAIWREQTSIPLPDKDISLRNEAITATIGYILRPDATCKISAVLSSGFRSPNIDDIGKIREKNGRVSVPNVKLKPEYAYNSELGILQYFNNRMFSISANVYYTLLDNYIIRAPFDRFRQEEGASVIAYDGEESLEVVANVNRGNAAIKGGTFSFQGAFDHSWKARGSVTYTEGRTYDTKTPLSSIPPLFGNLFLSYQNHKAEFQLGYEYNAAKKVKDYNLEEGIDNLSQTPVIDQAATEDRYKYAGTPSWETFNLSVHFEMNPNTAFLFQVDNIFDKHYKEFASGISAPGRNFSATLNYLF